MKSFEVIEDGFIPEWAQDAYQDGVTFYVHTSIGWVECDEPEFRNGVTYGFKE